MFSDLKCLLLHGIFLQKSFAQEDDITFEGLFSQGHFFNVH